MSFGFFSRVVVVGIELLYTVRWIYVFDGVSYCSISIQLVLFTGNSYITTFAYSFFDMVKI